MEFESALNKSLNDHQANLQKHTDSFQTFLERLLTAGVVVVTGILTWFGIKDRRGLKKLTLEIETQMKSAAESLEKRAQEQINAKTNEIVAKSEQVAGAGVNKVELLVADMQSRLEAAVKSLGQSEEQYRNLRKEMDAVEKRMQQDASERVIAKLVQDADDAIRTPSSDPSYRTTLTELRLKLEEAVRADSANVALSVRLGMIYARLAKFEEAVEVLQTTLEERRKRRALADGSLHERVFDADIEFNVACYLTALAKVREDRGIIEGIDSLKHQAWSALGRSIEGNSINWELAKEDSHLHSLFNQTDRNLDRLKPLVSHPRE